MIAIIGAGISGLTLAYELQKRRIEHVLLEASNIPGGCMQSEQTDGYCLEKGPNSIYADAQILSWIKELGLENEIASPSEEGNKRYIYKDGKIQAMPSNPISFFFGNFFSFSSKISLLKEFTLKPSENENETLGDFFERRFNKEIVDYGLSPFVAGIFAGDPYQLLVEKTFPFFLEYERRYGSVLKGFLKNKKSGSDKKGINFKGGISALPLALNQKVKNCEYNTVVQSVEKVGEGYKILAYKDNCPTTFFAEKVIITTPSFIASKILYKQYPDLSLTLSEVSYPPMAKVIFSFKKKNITQPLAGFGVLNPGKERRFLMGTIWTSNIYPNVCPDDETLLTCLVGGVLNQKNALESNTTILQKALAEIRKDYKIIGDPLLSTIYKLPRSIPQYDLTLKNAHEKLKALESENILFCVNWKDGASISDCIKKGIKMAKTLSEETISNRNVA